MKETQLDSEGTRKAFEELRPLLDEQTDLRPIRVDVGKAAALIAAAGRMVQKPEIRARFAEVPPQMFDIRHIERLERSGLALWYAAVQRKRAAVGASRSPLPANLVTDAVATKQRMMKVVRYHVGDDPAVAAELADISAGQGYADLSADLLRLVPFYEIHEELLRRDPTHYRADDRVRAATLAQRILECLGDGATGEDQMWREYVQRAWTFAVNTYEEVAATGRWLYRHEGGAEMFPSLFKTLRQSSGSRPDNNGDNDDDDDIDIDVDDTGDAGAAAETEAVAAAATSA